MLDGGLEFSRPGPPRGFMSNDKKPKKTKAKVVHGASFASRGNEVAANLITPVKKGPLAPSPKKK
jgi:hypothetical protein